MVRIHFKEPNSQLWLTWRTKCERETLLFIQAVGNNKPYDVSDLYKDEKIRKQYYLRDDLKDPFWRKCAYCEESIASQNGDIDHFRPKKRVSDDNYKPINGHNGYYWLAYDWKNLLPCCVKCNQRREWFVHDGKCVIGKQDRFPLENENERVYSHRADLRKERPLLINPLIEDPEKYLWVEFNKGLIEWNSSRGQKCVEVFGLNSRESLREGRKNAIRTVRGLLMSYFTYREDLLIDKARHCLIEIQKYIKGEKPFSLAARCYIKESVGIFWVEDRLKTLK
jgi:uncharacterized protein (TIGR02646 family)